MKRTIIEKENFTVKRDDETNELYVTLNDTDFHQYQLGTKQGKSHKVFMLSEPLRNLDNLLQSETKPLFVGNDERGYQKIMPSKAKGSVTNLGIF